MSKYTWKDIIIDPSDIRVEIGDEYYFANTPKGLIALSNSGYSSPRKLKRIEWGDYQYFPFVCIDEYSNGDVAFACLIKVKKEEN